jgi:hypothetical protein
MSDFIQPIVRETPPWVSNKLSFFKPEDKVSFRFRDSSGATGKAPLPDIVSTEREGQGTYVVRLLYLAGRAPRGGNGNVDTEQYDGLTLIVQSGVDEKTGKTIGKLFKNLHCTGWSWKTIEGVKYEQITCLTEVKTDW